MDVNVFTIAASLAINVLRRYSSPLSRCIVSRLYKVQNREMLVWRDELRSLRAERDTCNPMDEFAKFALVNRRINKLVDRMHASTAEMRSAKMAKQMFVNALITGLVVLMSLLLIWTNYDRPVVDFTHLVAPTNAYNQTTTTEEEEQQQHKSVRLFYPVDYIVSFPCTHRPNSIGVTFWLVIVNRLVEQLATCVHFFLTTTTATTQRTPATHFSSN